MCDGAPAQWAVALRMACRDAWQPVAQPRADYEDAQVLKLCWGERGRAEAVHLRTVPHCALLRAALPGCGVGDPPSSMQAPAGSCGIGVFPVGVLHKARYGNGWVLWVFQSSWHCRTCQQMQVPVDLFSSIRIPPCCRCRVALGMSVMQPSRLCQVCLWLCGRREMASCIMLLLECYSRSMDWIELHQRSN